MKRRTYIKLSVDCLEKWEALDNAERGELVTALLEYQKTGVLPKIEGAARVLFPTHQKQIDKENAQFSVQCKVNCENGKKGGRPKKAKKTHSVSEESETNPFGFPMQEERQVRFADTKDRTVIKLPLNDKTEYGVTQTQLNQWSELYPNVDVMQALRNILGWLQSNPKRRKTRGGIERFINKWLSDNQDKGKTKRTANNPQDPSAPLADWEKDWLEELQAQEQKGTKYAGKTI